MRYHLQYYLIRHHQTVKSGRRRMEHAGAQRLVLQEFLCILVIHTVVVATEDLPLDQLSGLLVV